MEAHTLALRKNLLEREKALKVSGFKNNSLKKEDSRKIRLFLSAPNDVEAERQKAHEIVKQINLMLGGHLRCHIELIEWKTHVAPDMGDPKEVVNRQIGAYDYDIFIGVLWKRFETVPGATGAGAEDEFKKAYKKWQSSRRPRILLYFSQAPYSPEIEDFDQWRKVKELKRKMQEEQKGLICEYRTSEQFAERLREHLGKILQEWFSPEVQNRPIADFSCYLKYLKEDTMYIDIRGLVTGEGKVHQFLIDQLYIPLKTADSGLLTEKSTRRTQQPLGEKIPGEVPLQEVLQEPKLIIKGDPGAGKTTFLKLITYTLCLKWLREEPVAGSAGIIWPESPPLPIFIRLGKLASYIGKWKEEASHTFPAQEDSLTWLFHFLEEQSKECNWKLSSEIFRSELEAGRCLILLDGLDEAPDPGTREKISSMAEQLLKTYPDCRVVLTSRPAALMGSVVPPGFRIAQIAPLDEQAMKIFLSEWCAVLYLKSPEKSRTHKQELLEALQARPAIRRMAKTPVMLTALAVVHWNESWLPEQRAELYESIIIWLLRTREQKHGRLKTDQCRKLLQLLALAMFTSPEGRIRRIGLRSAAEILVGEFIPDTQKSGEVRCKLKKMAVGEAERFLEQEMMDSGIIVKRDNELEFWHLSFQEYLAAYEIAGLLDDERLEVLFKKNRLYSSEWREAVLLLGGVLYKQGKEKINHLIDAIIKRGPEEATHKTLPQLAGEVGLLGGIVQDLSPFDFQPKNPRYQEVVKSVNGIFDKDTYRDIPVQVRIEAADALGQVGDPRLEGDPMIAILDGVFWMGAQKEDKNEPNFDPDASKYSIEESPVHQVELSPFSISAYPITVSQYRRFIEDGGYEDKRLWEAGGFGQFKTPGKWEDQQQYPSRPVVYISWYEAAAYACWAKGRLPTEAEWERAARGPSQEYRKYPWGNKEPDEETANFDDSKVGHITPVGIFPEDCSSEGVIDLAGNVREWCLDRFGREYYQMCTKQGVVNNPPGSAEGNARVVRGGAFNDGPGYLRCADRLYWYSPDLRLDYLGFRMVRGAQS